MSNIAAVARDLIANFTFASVIDILIVSTSIYWVLLLMRGTTAMTVLRGVVVVLGGAFLLSRVLDLRVVNWLLRNSVTGLVIALAVVFQPEIRRALERLGRTGFRAQTHHEEQARAIETVVHAASRLARQGRGALIIFERETGLREVIDTMVSGREILHSITIPEGLTSEQILQRIREYDLLSGDVRDVPKEGALLPETYRVARGMSRNDLIRKMQDDQKRVLDQIWARRAADLPLRSPYELLTLASIVEKETGKADERPRVAGVFINRLTKRMRLQSDPTIVYGLVGGKGTLGRGILRSEVERPTPYNTYQIEGLPPGPIANPGRAALEAVANPSRTKELYFVADGTGGHVFAETLEQHNRNVARWRMLEREMKAQQSAPAPVDRFQPDAPAAGGRDQRGDAQGVSVPIFGALSPTTSDTESPAPKAASPKPNAPATPAPLSNGRYGVDPKLDKSLGLSFPAPRNVLDGPMDDRSEDIDPNLYPMNAERRAQQRAQAVRFGLPSGSDDLTSAENAPLRGDTGQSEPAVRLVRIFDASEGTALDPLKNKTWDLNSPKTVPVLKPEDIGEKPAPGARKPKAQAAPPTAKPSPKQAGKPDDQKADLAEQVDGESAKPQVKVAAKPTPAPSKPKAKPARKPASDPDEPGAD